MNRRLTPPPRVESRGAGTPKARAGGIGWKTIAAFLLLGALTVSVFAFLPDWASRSPRAPEPESQAAALPSAAPEHEREPAPAPAPEPEPENPRPKRAPAPAPAPEPEPPPLPKPAPVDPTEADFTRAMSEGMTALNGQDFERAKAAFESARVLRPESREALDALAQADERIRLAAIAGHRERGAAFEAREAWRQAEAEYDQALAIEPTLLFARDGKARTKERAEIEEALAFHLSHPERLSDAAVLQEATSLLRKAAAVASPGPNHKEQLRKLEGLIDAYSRVVVAEIRSDGLTEVTIYRVGRLGRFESRSLELRPGRYTVIGSRDGYRDVRRDLEIEPGKTPDPLVVKCEETIR